jgi:hypothetical protein
MFSISISLLVVTLPSHLSQDLILKETTKEFKPQICKHYVVIMIIIVIIAMLTLWYSIMLHVELISFYHAFMLTLQKSLTSHALWLPQA